MSLPHRLCPQGDFEIASPPGCPLFLCVFVHDNLISFFFFPPGKRHPWPPVPRALREVATPFCFFSPSVNFDLSRPTARQAPQEVAHPAFFFTPVSFHGLEPFNFRFASQPSPPQPLSLLHRLNIRSASLNAQVFHFVDDSSFIFRRLCVFSSSDNSRSVPSL